MEQVTTIAVDIAKRVFAVFWVDPTTGQIGARKLTRTRFEQFMSTRASSRVRRGAARTIGAVG